MVYLILFAALAAAELASVSLIFMFKDMMHSVLALSSVFFFNSLLFLAMGQPLLALLQLFVMMGGVSTFLFVGVSSEGAPRFKRTGLPALALLSAALFAICLYGSYGLQFTEHPEALTAATIGNLLAGGVGQLYLMVFALFGVALGAILVLRKVEAIR
jgi:NADH:ubiquinone oxidoreductase subunit 6 (subunit J)